MCVGVCVCVAGTTNYLHAKLIRDYLSLSVAVIHLDCTVVSVVWVYINLTASERAVYA